MVFARRLPYFGAMPLALHKLTLTDFRSYDALRLDVGGARAVVLTGRNGAGKTNILEAISLLTPGKGLRGAELAEMRNKGAGGEDPWAIAAEIETADGGKARVGTGLGRGGKRRVVRIDGKEEKTQAALSERVSAVWLTPQMDRLFQEGASGRRRFLDRLVFALDPAHAGRLSRYERNMRERLALLQNPRGADPLWLDRLEAQMAQDAVPIAAARQGMADRLATHVAALATRQSLFPMPAFFLTRGHADELEGLLKQNRAADRAAGKTTQGPHRCDWQVRYAARDMPAVDCSTGEQKGLLIATLLSHALLMQAEKGFVPLMLLDEVAAHLDAARREQLFGILQSLDAQVFMTGADAEPFAALRGKAMFLEVRDGRVAPLSPLGSGHVEAAAGEFDLPVDMRGH